MGSSVIAHLKDSGGIEKTTLLSNSFRCTQLILSSDRNEISIKDKKIGETLNDKNNGISIKINDEILKFNVVENKEHIINVTNKDIILFSIIKSRLRFGRKNIYKIKSMEWKYDIELLILLVAFCDVVFFPEWRLFSWGELEYDLLEIDLKKNKK